MQIILLSMTVLLVLFLIIIIGDWIVLGIALPSFKNEYPKQYLIKIKNRMDMQKSTECSGFSTAYVLRSLGIDADGNDVYAKMPGKFKNGAVLPKNLKKAVRKYGLKVKYVKGTIDSLRAELCEGHRVIVLIKTRLDKAWLHYVPIVGYDEENIFIAESLDYLVNCTETYYNRSLKNHEFLKLWDTRMFYMPFYKNTYLVIERKTS